MFHKIFAEFQCFELFLLSATTAIFFFYIFFFFGNHPRNIELKTKECASCIIAIEINVWKKIENKTCSILWRPEKKCEINQLANFRLKYFSYLVFCALSNRYQETIFNLLCLTIREGRKKAIKCASIRSCVSFSVVWFEFRCQIFVDYVSFRLICFYFFIFSCFHIAMVFLFNFISQHFLLLSCSQEKCDELWTVA